MKYKKKRSGKRLRKFKSQTCALTLFSDLDQRGCENRSYICATCQISTLLLAQHSTSSSSYTQFFLLLFFFASQFVSCLHCLVFKWWRRDGTAVVVFIFFYYLFCVICLPPLYMFWCRFHRCFNTRLGGVFKDK